MVTNTVKFKDFNRNTFNTFQNCQKKTEKTCVVFFRIVLLVKMGVVYHHRFVFYWGLGRGGMLTRGKDKNEYAYTIPNKY